MANIIETVRSRLATGMRTQSTGGILSGLTGSGGILSGGILSTLGSGALMSNLGTGKNITTIQSRVQSFGGGAFKGLGTGSTISSFRSKIQSAASARGVALPKPGAASQLIIPGTPTTRASSPRFAAKIG